MSCPQTPLEKLRGMQSASFPFPVLKKQQGESHSHTNQGYLEWVLKTFSKSNPWWKAAADALAHRGKQKQPAKKNVHDLLSELKSCSRKRNLQEGRRVHTDAVETGDDSNMFVGAALINMYAKCGSMVEALQVFDSIQDPDVVSWTALILGYADNEEGQVALDLFSRMKISCGCSPDSVIYIAAIKACTSLAVDGNEAECLKRGRKIHSEIGHHMDHFVQNTLINMYAKCGSMVDAKRVFESMKEPNVVSWTAMILGYAENGKGHAALELFSEMKTTIYAPNSVTYLAAIKACTSLALQGDCRKREECLERGRDIHLEIGCHLSHFVQNALVDMYSKCGSMREALQVFNSMKDPDVVSCNTLILGYTENGEAQVALDFFSRMKTVHGCAANSVTYAAAIKACTSLAENRDESGKEECLKRGRAIHSKIGHHMDQFIQTALINMYAKVGSMSEARLVFNSIDEPNVVSWTSLIQGYAENMECHAALKVFSRMKATRGCAPNSVTYLAVIRACTSLAVNGGSNRKVECLKMGREVHSQIGCDSTHFVQNALVEMYSKCGSMIDARKVFEEIEKPNVVSWTALIQGYADNLEGEAAFDLFFRMKTSRGCAPDSMTYVASIKACTSLAADEDEGRKSEWLKQGKKLHLEIGQHMDHFVQSALIKMYAKLGCMVESQKVFDGILEPNVVSWTTLILGYADNGEGEAALDNFLRMRTHGCAPNNMTYVAVFKACASIGALTIGRKLHSEVTDFNVYVVTCLVDFYAKCGSMAEAREMFDSHSTKDISTWTALLAGYGRFGNRINVFNLFEALQEQGFRPNAVTFVCILLCCSHAGLVEKARKYLEAMPVQYGLTPTVMHYNCMVDVLGRANQLDEAVAQLEKMPCNPNSVTWMALLGACRKWKNVKIGRLAFHSLVDLDEKNAVAYLLMAQIYSSMGMWEEKKRLLEKTRKFSADAVNCG